MNQFRHWIAATDARRVVSAAAAMALAAAFIVASLIVAPEPATTEGPAVGSTPTLPRSTRDVSGPPGTVDTLPGGAPIAPEVPGQAGSATTVATASPNAPRIASDRGVTENEIKLGVIVPSSALGDAGFSLGDRGDGAQYARALAEYVNDHGGAAGRRVTIATRPTDPTSTADQAAACQSMLNDQKVFGVLDLALSNGPAQTCISQQGRTPYVHAFPWSTEFQALSGGFDVGYGAAIDRLARAMVRDFVASGWLEPTSIVGVLGDNCPTTKPTVDNVLVPALEEVVAKVEVGLHDCTIDAVLRQPPAIATRFRTAHVDRVIGVSNYISMQIFLQTAAGLGGWKPQYARSDWFSGVSDGQSKNYDANQYDGAIAITSTRRPLVNAGKAAYPGIDRCNEAARGAGLAPVDAANAEADAVLCDLFFLMVDGVNAAGPNPTRGAWAAAVQSLGRRGSAMWGPSSFGRGKTNGADQVYSAVWGRACKCWKATSGPRAIDG
jgi:hypothetical protein